MLQVDIVLAPGGWLDGARTIQRIVIWNTSDLAEDSEYSYVVSHPIPMGSRESVSKNSRYLAYHLDECYAWGTGVRHKRSRPVLELLLKVIMDSFGPDGVPEFSEFSMGGE